MHIKRIVIQGFKTYKNTTVIDLVSPHHNVVVGRNGSGKSNFFAAIRFVLSDAYTNMTREERQSLIHEGSGTVMSAYVEIVFDNTDRRFPINKDEIVIRRTIGMKKDDYSLDQRSATKSDITNLLESAGFSKSNPYYIVPQGRITALTNIKDSERLQLLKEVAGAKVFETKLKESLKEMNSTNKKRDQIDDVLKYIETRLDDLNLEKNDLKEFDILNTKKKILEYNLFDRELLSLNENIDNLEDNYSNALEEFNGLIVKLGDREKHVVKINSQMNDLSSTKKLIEIDKNENDAEIKELLLKIGETKTKIMELEVSKESNEAQSSLDNDNISTLLKLISQKETELNKILPKIQQFTKKESQLKDVLASKKLDQRSLLSKRGRSSQFTSKESRDEFLNEEILQIKDSIDNKKFSLKELTNSITKVKEALSAVDDKISKAESEGSAKSVTKEIKGLDSEIVELKHNYNKLIDERKTMWREQSKLNNIISTYQQEKTRVEEQVGEGMSRSMALGLESVTRIAKRLGLTGVYGPLGELIDVSEKYKTSVEVIGGSSLFYVVVDNDQTASIIMEELIREKSGRVTFMPLNRLKNKEIEYPENSNSVPLIKKIAYEDYLLPAVRQVFGKALVCMSLEVASEVSKSYNLNAITLDGDRCDRRGVLYGGFREQKRSRVDCLKELRRWKTEIFDTELRITQVQEAIDLKDQEINRANEKINSKKGELDTLYSENESILNENARLLSEKASAESELKSLESRISNVTNSMNQLKSQLSKYEKEVASPFDNNLSDEENKLILSLTIEIPEIEEQYNQVVERLGELELKSSSLKSELNENLYQKRKQLENNLNLKSSETRASNDLELVEVKRQLEDLELEKTQLEEENHSLISKIKEIEDDINKLDDTLTKVDENQAGIVDRVKKFTKSSERFLSRKLMLSNRRDDINRKIRELGVLPDEAFTSYKGAEHTSNSLLQELATVTEGLKQYSHVNKKALEQFINFTKQRNVLVERRLELANAKKSIENLIAILEKRKDEAINRAFKSVSVGFQKVFEQLVPAGTGKLIIQRRNERAAAIRNTDAEDEDEEDDDEMSGETPVGTEDTDNYIGVSISVSFNSKHDEQQRIEQLSGGQKSLCAIALILAIQRCDPAPFYLFDEVDANLDTQYRTAVAKLINELSKENAQFICTTFRPEMLQVADKFYGVMFNNKVSTVSEIDRSDALSFVEGQKTSSKQTEN